VVVGMVMALAEELAVLVLLDKVTLEALVLHLQLRMVVEEAEVLVLLVQVEQVL